MSQENVDLVERAMDALNRRDYDSFISLMAEDVVSMSRIAVLEGTLRGHPGVRQWWDSWFVTFPDYDIEIVETRDNGDAVVATLRALGHGGESRVPLEERFWHVSRWKEGQIVWWRTFNTEREALEAAGLPE
jgi:ketosteroid isomerase-like protein